MRKVHLRRRQQRGHRQPRTIGPANFRQEVKDMALLPTQGNNHRQETFDKAAASRTLSAKAAFAPENTATQGLFSRIVGRLHAFMVHKGPQCRFVFEQATAGRLGLLVRHQDSGHLQQGFNLMANGLHGGLERRVGESTITYPMPKREHLPGLGQQQAPYHRRLAPPVYQSLEIPLQMRPAELAALIGQPVIGAVPIRSHDTTIIRAQQSHDALLTSRCLEQKDRHCWGTAHPQPTRVILLASACFIYIDHFLLAQEGLRLLHRLGQRLAESLLLGRHGT